MTYVEEKDCYRRMEHLRECIDKKLWRIQILQITTLLGIVVSIIFKLL